VGQREPERVKSREWLRRLGFLFTIGWYVALSVLIPTGIGYWLDMPGQFNARPMYTLIGFAIGSVIAFYGLYRMLRRFYRQQKAMENTGKKEN
jgi:hypothetical protein